MFLLKKTGIKKKSIRNPIIKISMLFATILVLEILNIIFFILYEKWSFIDAVYFSITTITTVGYGDVIPTTSLGKSMCIIQMLLGTLFTTTFITMMIDYFIERNQYRVAKKLLEKKLDMKYLKELDIDNSGGVTLDEFMEFMLIKNAKVDKEFMDDLRKQFKKLDVNRDGVLNKEDLKYMENEKIMKEFYVKDLQKALGAEKIEIKSFDDVTNGLTPRCGGIKIKNTDNIINIGEK